MQSNLVNLPILRDSLIFGYVGDIFTQRHGLKNSIVPLQCCELREYRPLPAVQDIIAFTYRGLGISKDHTPLLEVAIVG